MMGLQQLQPLAAHNNRFFTPKHQIQTAHIALTRFVNNQNIKLIRRGIGEKRDSVRELHNPNRDCTLRYLHILYGRRTVAHRIFTVSFANICEVVEPSRKCRFFNIRDASAFIVPSFEGDEVGGAALNFVFKAMQLFQISKIPE